MPCSAEKESTLRKVALCCTLRCAIAPTMPSCATAKMCVHQSVHLFQGDHLSGKPGNVREFDNYQGNVRDFTENREMSGNCYGKNLVREKLPKTVLKTAYLCPYRYLVGVCCVLNVKYMVSDHILLHFYPHH